MEDRTKQFRVGVVVFATLILTALLILGTSDFTWSPFKEQYQLQVLVPQAPGVAPDTPVRRRGILIGRVDSVEDTDEGALLTLNIDGNKHVKSNETPRVQASLIGDAVVEFTSDRSPVGATEIQPGGPPIQGMYNPSPMDLIANLQGDLKQTIMSLGRAGDEVAQLADQLNTVLGDQDIEQLNRLIDSLEAASTNFASVMANLDEVLGDEAFKKELKEGLAELPQVMTDAREILSVLELAVGSADENLKNLQGLTGPLGERGPEMVAKLESSVDNLSELFGEAALLVKSVNTSEGTVGKLLHDDQLYNQLAGTIGQASAAVQDARNMLMGRDVQRRIRQILDNLWVITDKFARDPARVTRGIVPKNRELPFK